MGAQAWDPSFSQFVLLALFILHLFGFHLHRVASLQPLMTSLIVFV